MNRNADPTSGLPLRLIERCGADTQCRMPIRLTMRRCKSAR